MNAQLSPPSLGPTPHGSLEPISVVLHHLASATNSSRFDSESTAEEGSAGGEGAPIKAEDPSWLGC